MIHYVDFSFFNKLNETGVTQHPPSRASSESCYEQNLQYSLEYSPSLGYFTWAPMKSWSKPGRVWGRLGSRHISQGNGSNGDDNNNSNKITSSWNVLMHSAGIRLAITTRFQYIDLSWRYTMWIACAFAANSTLIFFTRPSTIRFIRRKHPFIAIPFVESAFRGV